MKLTEEQKNAIESEFKQWTETQYAGKDKKVQYIYILDYIYFGWK